MRALTTQRQLILELERSREQVLQAIKGLSEEQMSVRGIDGWSVKDHLIHLTAWDEMRFFEISRIARGGEASFPDIEDVDWLNNPVVEMRRGLPIVQILTDLVYARDMVLQAVAICPDERLDNNLYQGIGLEGGAEHDRSHAAAIKAWRKKERI